MRKIYAILLAVLLVLTLTVSAGATEYEEPLTEPATEFSESVTDLSTTLETEAETSPIEADSELWSILNGATPEKIEHIKNFIIYGVSALPFPDQVRVFAAENLNAIAWIFVGAMFLLYFVGNRMTKKSLSDSMAVNNNNMVEAYDDAKKTVKNATELAEATAEAVKKALESAEGKSEAMLAAAKACAEKTVEVLEQRSAEVFEKAKEGTDAALKAIEELKVKETGMKEAECMMAQVLCDLIEHSSLPEHKKDLFKIHLQEGMTKISEVEKDEH